MINRNLSIWPKSQLSGWMLKSLTKKKSKMKRAELPKRKHLKRCSWGRSEFVEGAVGVDPPSGTHSPVNKIYRIFVLSNCILSNVMAPAYGECYLFVTAWNALFPNRPFCFVFWNTVTKTPASLITCPRTLTTAAVALYWVYDSTSLLDCRQSGWPATTVTNCQSVLSQMPVRVQISFTLRQNPEIAH
jgi:hypothetical protein